jgi:hypothetical protein
MTVGGGCAPGAGRAIEQDQDAGEQERTSEDESEHGERHLNLLPVVCRARMSFVLRALGCSWCQLSTFTSPMLCLQRVACEEMTDTCAGQIVAFYLFDIAETIDLSKVPALIGARDRGAPRAEAHDPRVRAV